MKKRIKYQDTMSLEEIDIIKKLDKNKLNVIEEMNKIIHKEYGNCSWCTNSKKYMYEKPCIDCKYNARNWNRQNDPKIKSYWKLNNDK